MKSARVHRFPAAAPDDCGRLLAAIDDGAIDPNAILAILGKTEGNGLVNDFTRGFAVASLETALAPLRDAANPATAISMVMSGGTEGGLSPHLIVIEVASRPDASAPAEKSLAVAVSRTPPTPAEDIGRLAHVKAVADAVRSAMASADIDHPDDVHYVQVKCPLLTAARIEDAEQRGATVSTTNTLKSMGLSRGASALGVALALGELTLADIERAVIGTDLDLWSGRASCSAGIELLDNEIIVMGNSSSWCSEAVIGHGVMADALDVDAIDAAFTASAITIERRLSAADRDRILAVLAKAEPDPSGRIRGHRHTMLDDSDISATRHARALVGGVIGAAIGHTELFVSGGAEHQGPPGGGPVALLVAKAPPPLT